MPYHHNNGFRVPRLLIIVVAAAVSVGIGALTGHILGDIQAKAKYDTAVQDINQSIETQLKHLAEQSIAANQVAVARKQIDAAKTYPASLVAIDTLQTSLDSFGKATLKSCTSEGSITELNLTAITKSNYIPANVQEGFSQLRETATENDACDHAKALVAYNKFSVFTLGASVNVNQINTSQFEDEAAIKNLQTLLQKAPTATDIQTLEKKYGTDFTGYIKAHGELIKSYTSLLTAKTPGELALYGERIRTNSENLQPLSEKSLKSYKDVSLKESKATLEQTKRLYSEATIINKMTAKTKVNEVQISGAIIVNALTTYTQETGAYPTSQSITNLLMALKAKNYITDTTPFQTLRYTRDNATSTYKLTIPADSGQDIIISFPDKDAKPATRAQPFRVQT